MVDESLRSVTSMISANLILESFKRLDRQLSKIVLLGSNFGSDTEKGQKERGKAISLTAGNFELNQQLITYINLLLKAIKKKYPYQPLIDKRKKQVLQAFNYAMGGHFSNWESLIQEMMIKVIGSNALFNSGQVTPKNLVDVLGNIKELDDRSKEKIE